MTTPKIIWQPHPGMQTFALTLPKVVDEVLLGGGRGSGKGFKATEPVLTPLGWKTMGDLEEGSVICNPDGTNQKVVQVFHRGLQDMYRVTFSDGTVIDCDGDHLWFAKISNQSLNKTIRNFTPLDFEGSIYNTKTLHERINKYPNKRPLIPCPEPIKYTQAWTEQVDAYLIGLIIGDGCVSGEYTGMTTADAEIAEYITDVGFKKSCTNSEIDYRISKQSWVAEQVTALGLRCHRAWEKFIPERIMRGSIKERLSCLQGLMDSDGTADKDGVCSFTSTSLQLTTDTRQLILSLGGWATTTERRPTYMLGGEKKQGRLAYTLYIQFPNKVDLFRLTRKKERVSGKNYMHGRLVRTIQSIEKLDTQEETICIVVNNPNRLFITTDFVVTHNSDVMLMMFAQHVGKGHGSSWRGIIFRNSYTALTDLVATSRKWFGRIFPAAKFNGSTHTWKFPDGEELLLRYARVSADYDAYHGWQVPFCVPIDSLIRTPQGPVPIGKLTIGDYVNTPQGPKKVTRIYPECDRPCLEASTYDVDSHLIGRQQLAVTHPVLTNDGWQSLGSLGLYQNHQQYLSCVHFSESIHKLVLDVCQEIRKHALDPMYQYQYPSVLPLHTLLHSVYQNALQLHSHLHPLSSVSLQDDIYQETQEFFDYASRIEGNDNVKFSPGLQEFSQLQCSCTSKEFLEQEHRLLRLTQLLSTGYRFLYKLLVQSKRLYTCQTLLYQDLPQLHELQQLIQDQIELSGVSACEISYLDNIPNSLDGYQSCHDFCDVLSHLGKEIFLGAFPSQTDVQGQCPLQLHLDEQDNKQLCIDFSSNIEYTHPYTHESQSTTQSLNQGHYTASLVGNDIASSILRTIDIEVEGSNTYIHDNSSLVNKNCMWDEITNWATPELYLKLMSINRCAQKDVPRIYGATTNPSGIGARWVKGRFVDVCPPGQFYQDPETKMTRVYLHSCLDENRTLVEADPTYLDKLKSATSDDENLHKAWILGEWDLSYGGFFSDIWDDETHILPNFQLPASWRVMRSFDWGSAKPWAVSYFAITNGEQPELVDPDTGLDIKLPYFPPNATVVFDEIYGWDGTPDTGDRATSQEIAERVLEKDADIQRKFGIRVEVSCADTSIYAVSDGTSIGQNLSKHGCHWTRAYKGAGSRVSGWALLRTMLGAAKRKDLEKEQLYFCEKAFHHIRCFTEIQHDTKNPEDVDTTGEDHILDSLRYGITRRMSSMSRSAINL